MTSVSVSLLKATPSLVSISRRARWFSMMPLWATAIFPDASKCGWVLASVTPPCVAQRVWPMPQVPAMSLGTASRSDCILPTRRTVAKAPLPCPTEIPAES